MSCNPVTFAEDAKRLEAKGYVLDQVGVYDMFPERRMLKPSATCSLIGCRFRLSHGRIDEDGGSAKSVYLLKVWVYGKR